MSEIKKALVTAMVSDASKQKLKAALSPAQVEFCMPYGPGAKEAIAKAASDVDVAIMNGDVEPSVLKSPNLKWIHCCRAGVEKTATAEIFEKGIILTSSGWQSAPALAEHVLTFMLGLTYNLPGLFRAQTEHRWAADRNYFMKTGLYKKTVGIIGLGNTGLEVARLCKSFDMKTLGYRRSKRPADNVDEVYAAAEGDDIKALVAMCDYIVLCIELNDDTWHLINKEVLEAMKPSAYLINMGRGALVDEPELIKALQNRTIAGAGLDTFEVEPLPDESPIWDLPNVIITPHITPKLPDAEERKLSYVYQNIEAYKTGGKFVNRITQDSVLTKGGH